MEENKTAGELANKALSDKTKYKAREVAEAVTDDIMSQLYQAVENYQDKIEEPQFCVVMVIAGDPLIHNMKRRKFYCWPWLPSPRPNQAVFLYDKAKQQITKRLWVLPCDVTMAELCSPIVVSKEYASMKKWSESFFRGTFWEDIRKEHNIKMLSQEEYFQKHSTELSKARLDNPDSFTPKPFDFSKIDTPKVNQA